MKKIWKYELSLTPGSPTRLQVPNNPHNPAIPIAAQVQDGFPVIWFEVDPEGDKEEFLAILIGTGWEVPEEAGQLWEYLSTIQVEGFVGHVYVRFPD